MKNNGFENKEICKKCDGKCCKSMSGATFPIDFNLPDDKNKLVNALKSGYWAIDWWEGDPRSDECEIEYEIENGYFVRPSIKGKKGVLLDPSWGGECIFLHDSGCSLIFNDRPHNCRFLEPVEEEGKCIAHDKGKHGAAIAWIPFNEFLENIKLTVKKS